MLKEYCKAVPNFFNEVSIYNNNDNTTHGSNCLFKNERIIFYNPGGKLGMFIKKVRFKIIRVNKDGEIIMFP